jgi:hypothetical protein
MVVIFADGSGRRARVLQLSGPVMRAAIEGLDDVAEFTLVNGSWLCDDNQQVQFLFSLDSVAYTSPRGLVTAIRGSAACTAGGTCLLARVAALELSRSA